MEVDEALIALISKCPDVYDKRNDHYKDFQQRQEAWESIAQTLKLDVETVRRRWDNLRDRFVRVYREYTALGDGNFARSKFKLFDHMMWLAPHIRKRRITPMMLTMKSMKANKFLPHSLLKDDNNQDNEISDIHESFVVKTETQSNSSGMAYQDDLSEDVLLTSTANEAVSQSHTDVLNKADHYFIMSVLHDCQGMPPRKKLKFKREVLDLLDKYLYEDDDKI